jgi:hypothetical protein
LATELFFIFRTCPSDLERWNIGQNRMSSVSESRLLVRLWSIRINCYDFSMNRRIFQRDGLSRTPHSSIPSFHHSNGERSDLSSPPPMSSNYSVVKDSLKIVEVCLI